MFRVWHFFCVFYFVCFIPEEVFFSIKRVLPFWKKKKVWLDTKNETLKRNFHHIKKRPTDSLSPIL